MGVWEMTAIIILKSLWWIIPSAGGVAWMAYEGRKYRR